MKRCFGHTYNSSLGFIMVNSVVNSVVSLFCNQIAVKHTVFTDSPISLLAFIPYFSVWFKVLKIVT